jgi:glycerate-2-kinase
VSNIIASVPVLKYLVPCSSGEVRTDGSDGPTDAAGAFVAEVTDRLPGGMIEALRKHNAYLYLAHRRHRSITVAHKSQSRCVRCGTGKKRTSQIRRYPFMTGPTETNVADIYMVLVQHNRDE